LATSVKPRTRAVKAPTPDYRLLTFLYGGTGSVPVGVAADGTHYVQLNLNGHQFCILA
jgi:hypothetical protein